MSTGNKVGGSNAWRELRAELGPMVELGGPVVAAELGWSGMFLMDTVMVGRLGAEALGAVSLGGVLFHALALFGLGMMLGLDTLTAQAFGAGKHRECDKALMQGVILALVLTPPLMGSIWLLGPLIRNLGADPLVGEGAVPYLRAVSFSTAPLLLYAAFRRYLQAMNLVRPVMLALLTANAVNFLGNWLLIFGHWGFPKLGVEGAGWATCLSRVYMAAVLFGYVVYWHRTEARSEKFPPLRLDRVVLARLVRLGFPAAMQITLEVGVFAAAAAIAARLEAAALAAHQVAITAASITYMVPLGISSAGAVRVGQAAGRGDARGVRRSGWTALLLGAGFMSLAGLMFLVFPRQIIRAVTGDARVLETGVSLLAVAAAFQLFDGTQIVATGALRGLGDTKNPMITNLVAYWGIGLPLGAYLCFSAGLGVIGIWTGLCAALMIMGAVLLLIWRRATRRFSAVRKVAKAATGESAAARRDPIREIERSAGDG